MNQSSLPARPKKRFSLKMLADAFHVSIERFPVTSVMIAVTTLWLLIYIIDSGIANDNINIAFNFVLPMECLLSLAVSIWCRILSADKWKETIAQTVTAIILLCDMVYLCFYASALSSIGWLGHIAAGTAGFVAILFVSSRHKFTDRMSWIFTDMQLSNIFTTACISLGLFIASSVICLTIDTLLVTLSYKVYAVIEVLLCFTLCSFILLSRIPTGDECLSKSESYAPARFRIGLIKFLILPITFIYMAILYVYGLKLLLLWELPDGIICWSVSGVVFLVVFVLFQLEALRERGADSYTSWAYRLLPWLMIPLLLMMSVAIGYRINQYGITPSRLYVVTFNLWAYAAFVYLGCRRKSWRLNRVAMSFALVFVITSIIPGANLTYLSNSYMQNSVKRQLVAAGIKAFPADRKTFANAYETLDPKSKRDIYEKLHYLDSWNNHDLISGIITFPVYAGEYGYYIDPIFQPYISDKKSTDINYNYRFQNMQQYRIIPEGCTKFREINRTFYDNTFENGTIAVKDGTDSLILNIRQLEKLKNYRCINLRMPGDSLILVPTNISITIRPEDGTEKLSYCQITGYIFKK